LLEDVLTSVIDNVVFGFVDDKIVEGCLIEDRFNKSFGIDDDGIPLITNELVEDDGCFDFIECGGVSSGKFFSDCGDEYLSLVSR
jgi:hypothetical protein